MTTGLLISVDSFMFSYSAVVKNWKKRWFVLDSLDNLSYYKDRDDEKPAGVASGFFPWRLSHPLQGCLT